MITKCKLYTHFIGVHLYNKFVDLNMNNYILLQLNSYLSYLDSLIIQYQQWLNMEDAHSNCLICLHYIALIFNFFHRLMIEDRTKNLIYDGVLLRLVLDIRRRSDKPQLK